MQQFFYDWQAATKLAKTEWGFKTRRDAREAVERDFEHLRGWVNGDWHWAVLAISTTVNGKEYSKSLGGIDSLSLDEFLKDMAEEIEYEIDRHEKTLDAFMSGL